MRNLGWMVGALALGVAIAPLACEKKPAPGNAPRTASTDTHGGGAATTLGTATIGGFEVTVSVEDKVTPGAEAHVDVGIKGAAKPNAVRVWVGTESAEGSVKSRADAEGEGYHAHVDVPGTLPAGSRLWVEIEDASGKSAVGGFDLKP